MMKMIRYTLLILTCLGFHQSHAQLTIDEFIGSAVQDYEVKTFDNQITYLNRKPYRLSPLRELELRYQNRELLDTQNEFALRFSPANPWEMKATGKYYRDVQASKLLEKELALKDALLDRYLTILKYLYYRELRDLSVAGQESLDKQLSILEQQSGSSNFDPDDYAELKVDQLDYESKQHEYTFEVNDQVSRVARLYPKAHRREVAWDPNDIISVERIKIVVDSLVLASVKSTFVSFQRQQINVAKSHYNMEKTNINLGFGQLEYDFRRYNQERTPYNVSFGVTIPVTNPNKPDMARRKLQVIEAEHDLEEAAHETETDMLIHQEKLTRLITSYTQLKARIAELENSNLAQMLSSMKGGNPFLFVQFNERIRKLDSILLKIKNNIMVTYIEYLAFSDHLQHQPLVNFLSPQLANIESR